MSTTILSVMLFLYCQIILKRLSNFIILSMLKECAVKYIILHCGFSFVYDKLNILYKICL